MIRRYGVLAVALGCAMLIVVSAMAQPPGGRPGGGVEDLGADLGAA